MVSKPITPPCCAAETEEPVERANSQIDVHPAGTGALGQQAQQCQTQLDNALQQTPRLRGSFKATTRYDDNPGGVPSTDIFGVPMQCTDSAGHLYMTQFDYSLYRAYKHSMTAGYSLMGTSSYETHSFDLLDNAVYLAGTKRSLWRDMPVTWALR